MPRQVPCVVRPPERLAATLLRRHHRIREEGDMRETDLQRRVGQLQAAGKGLSTLTSLWRRRTETTVATAADCVQTAKEPSRRLEPLRRHGDTALSR